MAFAGAMDDVIDRPAGWADALLSSLRRDAFVMEAGAYEEPALAKVEAYRRLYPTVHRQLQHLFGPDILTIVAIDAQVREDGRAPERQMVLGYQWDRNGDGGEPLFRIVKEATGWPSLSQAAVDPKNLAAFASDPFPITTVLDAWSRATRAPARFVIAPYVVRPVFSPKPSTDLIKVLDMMGSDQARQFLHTAAFTTNEPPIAAADWLDAYYLALLFVVCPAEAELANMLWLEAVHISFQLSWGFPLLAAQRQRAIEMANQNRRLARVQSVAEEVATALRRAVQNETSRILKELDHARFLDNEELTSCFSVGGEELNTGGTCSVKAQHHADSSDQVNCNFVAFVIHRLFEEPVKSELTSSGLLESARRVILAQPAPWPHLLRLLLDNPRDGFEVLKELCLGVHREGGQFSFYSLAVRLLIRRTTEPPLRVTIRSKSSAWELSSDVPTGYRSPDVTSSLTYADPRFPSPRTATIAPATWVNPLVRFVEALQVKTKDKQHVFVSEVAIVDAGREGVKLSLELDVLPDDRGSKSEYVNVVHRHFDSPEAPRGLHDFRSAVRELKAVIAQLRPFIVIDWPADSARITLTFSK